MGVRPELYPALAALRGDPSDNIPGVPGVGEKTAAKLINEFGSVEEVLRHLDSLPPKLKSALEDYRDQLALNVKLTPLVRDVPLGITLDELELGPWNPRPTEELFRFLELRKTWDRTLAIFGSRIAGGGGPVHETDHTRLLTTVTSPIEAVEFVESLPDDKRAVYLDVVWTGVPGRSELAVMALAESNDSSSSTMMVVPPDVMSVPGAARQVFESISRRCSSVDGVGLKEVLRYLFSAFRILFPVGIDGAVAGYLLDPSAPGYDLHSLAAEWLGSSFSEFGSEPASGGLSLGLEQDRDEAILAGRVDAGLKTISIIGEALTSRSLDDLYANVEKPLITVLAKMEALGILVDKGYLSRLQREFAAEAFDLQKEIQEIAGQSFNVNSTQQLGKVLFEKLALPPLKRTKTGYSTDARSLERLVGMHPIVEKIMRYREVEKLRSTYGEGLISEIASDGRIHASFSQTVARTGRLSSDHPNLHNIPIRTEDGRRFRNAFIAPQGRRLVIADYSQIELRVIAHLSKDPGLVEAFAQGIDIHRQTASYTFGVPLSEVTPSQRNKAKMVAYGLAYGMEAYGLSQRLGISVSEADEILKAFFAAFPEVSSYMKQTVDKARRDGFTTTEFGRIRPLPELSSHNFRLREAAERQAMNAGIQGLAADIFKIALVKLDKELASFDGDIVLQVHDEVLVECGVKEVNDIEVLVKRVLEGAVQLSVPLEVNVYSGTSWADAK